MNEIAATNEQPEPKIEALPAPDPIAILRGQIETLTVERDVMKRERDGAKAELTRLQERLKLIEENPFLYTLNNIEKGVVLAEAGDLIKTLCASVEKRQEKGALTLKIGVKPFRDSLIISGSVVLGEPKEEPASSIFFAGSDGTPSRSNERQGSLPFGGADEDPED